MFFLIIFINFGFLFCRLVDEINYIIEIDDGCKGILFVILGFFWLFEIFFCDFGVSVVQDMFKDGEFIYFYGVIMDVDIGKGILGVVFDMW